MNLWGGVKTLISHFLYKEIMVIVKGKKKDRDLEQSTVISLRDKPAAESQIKTSPNVSAWTWN